VLAVGAILGVVWLWAGKRVDEAVGKPVATVSPKPVGPALEREDELVVDPPVDDARRRDVAKAIDAVLAEMKACLGAGPDTVVLVFAPSGEVREASLATLVEDAGAKTCIPDAGKKARIHPFLGPAIEARYPVRR
jgi:hypothetical protein